MITFLKKIKTRIFEFSKLQKVLIVVTFIGSISMIIEGPRIIHMSKKIDSGFFTIALIPDTQKYTLSKSHMKIFDSKIRWILDNIKKEKISLITHVGDVIHSKVSKENKISYRNVRRKDCFYL